MNCSPRARSWGYFFYNKDELAIASSSLTPDCFKCKHMRGLLPSIGWSCAAFDGKSIPTSVLASSVDHRSPLAGDNGLRFEPVEAEDVVIATDPPVSEAQRRAMFAAKAGHSTLGIPRSVGEEFAEADPGGKLPTHARDMTRSGWKRIFEGLSELSRFFSEEEREPEHQEAEDAWERKGRAASVAFTTKDGRLLLVRRGKDEDNWPDTWSLPGGHVEEGEDFPAAAQRECHEELGDCGLSFDGIRELDRVRTAHDFEHVTYAVPVKDAFDPKLNDEHYDFCWAPVTKLPEPIHPGVKATIDGIILDGIKPYISKVGNRWELLDKDGNVVATASSMEELQPRLKQLLGRDSTVDPDRRVIGRNQTYKYPEYDRLAHDEMPLDVAGALAEDREPARTVDESGHMHVKDSVLTKAVVSPYKGSEINGVMQDEPGWVPLDPDKTYQLLRDPKELEKALSSFNGLPLLWVHKAATAEDHPTELVIGSTGTNAKFNGTDLTNDLSIWPQYATKAIEDGEKKNLSMGYGYKAVMEPGDHNGHNYDGRMINIKGNHCALVTAPRVPGSKVAGDAMPNEIWENIAAAISGMAA